MDEDFLGKRYYVTDNVYFNCSWDGTNLNTYRVNLCYTKLKDNSFILLMKVNSGLSLEECKKLILDIIDSNRFIQSINHVIVAPKINTTFSIQVITFSKPKVTHIIWFDHNKYTDQQFESRINDLLIFS